MAQVKIILENGESEGEVCDELCKAFSHNHGAKAKYEDSVLQQIEDRWLMIYSKVLKNMVEEIVEELEESKE